MQNSIKVINLKKSYGKKEAVKNINFEIKQNEIIGYLVQMDLEKPQLLA